MNLRPGCVVRQRVQVIKGVVTPNGIRWNPGYEKFEVLVAYAGTDGTPQERWFLEDEVEMVEAAPVAAEAVETLAAGDVQTIDASQVASVESVLGGSGNE
jgi:predicted DNA-binding protein